MLKSTISYTIVTWWASWIGNSIMKSILKNKKRWVIVIDKLDKSEIVNSERVIYIRYDLQYSDKLCDKLNDIVGDDIKINHLVNNAWYQENVDILKLDIDARKMMYDVTVHSAFILSQWFSNRFIKNKQSWWTIINITSIHSDIIREIPHYSSSKSALSMMTKEFAYRLAKKWITVNSIAPGAILTPLIKSDLCNKKLIKDASKQIPLWTIGNSSDISNMVIYLQSNKWRYVTGTSIVIDWWLSLVI